METLTDVVNKFSKFQETPPTHSQLELINGIECWTGQFFTGNTKADASSYISKWLPVAQRNCRCNISPFESNDDYNL